MQVVLEHHTLKTVSNLAEQVEVFLLLLVLQVNLLVENIILVEVVVQVAIILQEQQEEVD